MSLPMNVSHPCCWTTCPFTATSQVTVPAPPWLGGQAIAWFCARHERVWQIAMGTRYSWINYSFGRAPLFGWGMISHG